MPDNNLKKLEIDEEHLIFKHAKCLERNVCDCTPSKLIGEFNDLLDGKIDPEDPSLNLYKLKNIAERLLVLLKANYKGPRSLWMPQINAQKKAVKKLIKATEENLKTLNASIESKEPKNKINEVVINFCGTGGLPFIDGSAHDDFLLRRLKENDQCVGLNIRGVGIDHEGNPSSGFKTGSGMAERIQEAVDFLVKLKEEGHTLDKYFKSTILGHSRGAVQALALGKLLEEIGYGDTNNLIIAHDPVVGDSVDNPKGLKQKVKTKVKGKSSRRSVGELLRSSKKTPAKLKVIVRANDRRRNHFRILAEENAYIAEDTFYLSKPGYHNTGVLNNASSNLDALTKFKSQGRMLRGLSQGANQVGKDGQLDPNRKNFKEGMYREYSAELESFYIGSYLDPMSNGDVSSCYSSAIVANPAYNVLCSYNQLREIPEFMRKKQDKCDYTLDRLLNLLNDDQKTNIKGIIELAVARQFDRFQGCLEELGLDQLFVIYTLIEGGVESPKLLCEASNQSSSLSYQLMKTVRQLAKQNPLRYYSYGRTARWQRSLHLVKQAMIEERPHDTLCLEEECLRSVLSQHNGQAWSLGRKTKSIRDLEALDEVEAARKKAPGGGALFVPARDSIIPSKAVKDNPAFSVTASA